MNKKTILTAMFFSIVFTFSFNISAMKKRFQKSKMRFNQSKKDQKAANKLLEFNSMQKSFNKFFQGFLENPEKCPKKRKNIAFIEGKWEEAIELHIQGSTPKSIKLMYEHVAYQQLVPDKRICACLCIIEFLIFNKTSIDLDTTNNQIIKECLHTLLKYENQEKLGHSIKGEAHRFQGIVYSRKLKEYEERIKKDEKKTKEHEKKLKKYGKNFIFHMEKARKEFALELKQKDDVNNRKPYLLSTFDLAKYFVSYIHDNYNDPNKLEEVSKIKEKAISCLQEITSYKSESMDSVLMDIKSIAHFYLTCIDKLPNCKKLYI